MKEEDKDILENVISECVAAGIPELDSVIKEARRTLIAREYRGAQGAFLCVQPDMYESKVNCLNATFH